MLRRTVLISLSGIDGAGKSTQIASIHAYFKDAGLRIEERAFWDDAATLKQFREAAGHTIFKGDKGVGTPEAPIQRHDKDVRSPWMTGIRLVLYLLDALSLRRIVRIAQRTSFDVILFDRYIYDELANLDLRVPASRLYSRLIMKLVPHPDLSLILDADPIKAHARKPEYALDFLHTNREAYLELARIFPNITVIPALPLDLAKAEVIQHLLSIIDLASPAARQAEGPEAVGAEEARNRSPRTSRLL